MGLLASAFRFRHQSTPATPSSGQTALYSKSDNLIYSKGVDGVERLLLDDSLNNAVGGIPRLDGSGDIADAQLPPRLNTDAPLITDWNNATSNGWFKGNAAANGPTAEWYLGYVVRHDGTHVTQRVWGFTIDTGTDSRCWERRSIFGSGWLPWRRVRQFEGELDERYARAATWIDYTPTTSGFNLGTGGTVRGRYHRIGDTVHFKAQATLGSGTPSMGTPTISLPFTAQAFEVGVLTCRAGDSGNNTYFVHGLINSQVRVAFYTISGINGGAAVFGPTVPFTWSQNDDLVVAGTYEAVPL